MSKLNGQTNGNGAGKVNGNGKGNETLLRRLWGQEGNPLPREYARDVAIAAALHYLRRSASRPTMPERMHRGWHQASRRR
jgi:hypothetical protein